MFWIWRWQDKEKYNVSPKRDDKILTVLEASLVHMGWQQSFHLREEMRKQIIVVIRQAKLYADKIKDAPLIRSPTQFSTYNTVVTLTDDDLLLGSKPHNRLLFVIG